MLMARTDQAAPAAAIHVDLDGATQIFACHGWRYDAPRDALFESGMQGLLAFLEANELRATLFAIAEDVNDPRKRPWLERAVRAGHEIASHGLTHTPLSTLDSNELGREVCESRTLLEDALGVEVRGFRAPQYKIDRRALDLIADAGYAYDSSLRPGKHHPDDLGLIEIPAGPFRPFADRPLFELPLPSHAPDPLPFSPSYSLLLGEWYFRRGLRRHRRTHQPFILLFHLTDFSAPLDHTLLPSWRAKIFTLSNMSQDAKVARCQSMLDACRGAYEFTDTSDLVSRSVTRTARKRRIILAISTTHETGAAIFADDEPLAAVSEERLDRVKFSTCYPPEKSIDGVMRTAGIEPHEIDDVVISGLPASQVWKRTVSNQWRDFTEFHAFNDYFPHFNKALYRGFYLWRSMGYGAILRHLRQRYGIEPRLHFVEHHQCHAAAAYRTAPFDDALIVTADGVGDELSLTISTGRAGRIERLHEIPYPHSFGQFYTACTQILGFRGGRHEGKITGLSGFGEVKPDLLDRIRRTIKATGPDFRLHKGYYSEGFIRGVKFGKLKRHENLFDALEYRNYKASLKRVIDGYSREDIAAVFQHLLEAELANVVRPFAESTGLRNLALAGGIFANVKANHALFRALDMDEVYIFPHMGDGGLSFGAALELLQTRPKPFDAVYFGAGFSDDEMEAALKAAAKDGLRYRREEHVESAIAEQLVARKVIARFNGRMEFGPRALGNRSILYSAGDRSANKWLNNRLHRTEFMPFAPVAMMDKAAKCFTDLEGKEHACKFMTIIVDCTELTKEKCPAIVHVDGTARPQLVSREINPSMYGILEEYEKRTGIPLVVNTSYNMHEEPIVCTPEDGVRAFLDSRLDFLAMGPFMAWIEGAEPAAPPSSSEAHGDA